MAFVPIMMLAVSAASTAMAAYGKIQQGKTEAANAHAQESAANYNAAISTQNANTAGQVATSRELQQRRQGQQQLGNMRAAQAEGGGFGGTNAGVANQSAVNSEMDALNTRYSGVLQSNNFRNQTALDVYQGKVAGANATSAKQAGYWGAATDIVGGASKFYQTGYNMGSWGGG